jgi:oligosaccharide repeat unit polymerase
VNTFTNHSPSYSMRHAGFWKMLLLVFSSIIAVVACYLVMQPPQLHADWSTEVSVVSLVYLGTFFVLSLLLFKTPYLFTGVYLLALSLFHLGITVPESLGLLQTVPESSGLIQVGNWRSGSLVKWLEQAGWYTVLALACIGIGFSLSVTPTRLRKMYQPMDPERKNQTLSLAFQNGIGLLLASGVMLGLAIASFGNLLSYSRVDFFRGTGDTRGLGVFLMTFPSAVTLVLIGARTRLQRLFAWLLFLFGFALIMLSGYRAAALYPMLIGAAVWVKVGRRIPMLYATIAGLILVMAISAIGILRTYRYQEMDSKKLEHSVESSRVEDTFVTLGQTGGLLAHVLRLVPHTDPFRYGWTYVQYVQASIPNITGSINKSDRSIALRDSRTDPKAIARTPPSDWLTYRVLPEKFAVGEGVGFTGIGEPYLNFGLPGVVIFFVVLGYFLGRLDLSNLLEHPAMLVFSTAILWRLIQTVRDDFGNFIKPMVFIYIMLMLWRMVLRIFGNFPATPPQIPRLQPVEQIEKR